MAWLPEKSSFDDEQNRIFDEILDDDGRSWWIKGYAGTGKTMLLAHLAIEYIAQGVDCVYVTYTHALKNLVIEAVASMGIDSDDLPVYTVDSMNAIGGVHDLVLVDEVQDLPDKKIKKLLEHGERFIFAGDLNQSIFLNSAKPESIKRLLGNPKVVELRDIYRLPEAISYASHLVYPEAESAENALVDVVENSSVNLVACRSALREVEWVYQQALREARAGSPSAILFSRHEELQDFVKKLCKSQGLNAPPPVGRLELGGGHDYAPINKFLKQQSLSLMYFGGAGGGDLKVASKSKTVLLMTLHSAKGLEFDSVFMPFMNEERYPCPYLPMKNKDEWQRRFIYVGLTRTRLNFYATYTGEISEYLESLTEDSLEESLNYLEV